MSGILPTGRLHPWSWVFYATRAVGELALPLIVVLVLRRDDDYVTLLGAAGTAVFVIGFGVLRSRSFRFEVLADELVIREGVLIRELRHVPFSRIQSVSERQGLLHRLLRVTELVLESGAGGKPEAVMRVLDPRDATRIGDLLRQRRAAVTDAAEGIAVDSATAEPARQHTATPPQVLLKLPTDELITMGVISNRGLVVVALVAGALSQNAELLRLVPGIDRLPEAIGAGVAEAGGVDPRQLFAGLLVLLLSGFVFIRLLSVIHAIFAYHDFTLERSGDRLRVRRGLLTRIDVSGRVSGLQRLVLEQTVLHRLFRRCRIRVDLASQSVHTAGIVPQLNQLAPIATLPQAEALLRECVPGLELDRLDWRPLHGSAASRRWLASLRWLLPIAAAMAIAALLLSDRFDVRLSAALCGGLLLVFGRWYAAHWAATAAHAIGPGVLAWRSGVYNRRWVLVFSDRAQALILRRSPRDRRERTAQFCLDMQGALLSRALQIPFVAEGDAQALAAGLRMEGAVRREPGADLR